MRKTRRNQWIYRDVRDLSLLEHTLCVSLPVPHSLLLPGDFLHTAGDVATDSLELTFRSCIIVKERSSFSPAPATAVVWPPESITVVKCSDCPNLAHGPPSVARGSMSVTRGSGLGGGHRLDKDDSHFATQLTHPLLPIYTIPKMSLLKVKCIAQTSFPWETPRSLLNTLPPQVWMYSSWPPEGINVPPTTQPICSHYGEEQENNKNVHLKKRKGNRRWWLLAGE